jgi:hypothetical protein
MIATTPRDRVRSEVFDACAAHYCPKHAAFLAETLLDPIPNAAEEEFRRMGMADFLLRDGTLPVGMVLGLLAGHLNTLWGEGACPVAGTLYHRGRALYREWWDKRLREHEAALWRIRNGVGEEYEPGS